MIAGSFPLLLFGSCLKFYASQSKLLGTFSVPVRPLSAGTVPRSHGASGPEPHPGLLQGVWVPGRFHEVRECGVLTLSLRRVAWMLKEAGSAGSRDRARLKESEHSLTDCGNDIPVLCFAVCKTTR